MRVGVTRHFATLAGFWPQEAQHQQWVGESRHKQFQQSPSRRGLGCARQGPHPVPATPVQAVPIEEQLKVILKKAACAVSAMLKARQQTPTGEKVKQGNSGSPVSQFGWLEWAGRDLATCASGFIKEGTFRGTCHFGEGTGRAPRSSPTLCSHMSPMSRKRRSGLCGGEPTPTVTVRPGRDACG